MMINEVLEEMASEEQEAAVCISTYAPFPLSFRPHPLTRHHLIIKPGLRPHAAPHPLYYRCPTNSTGPCTGGAHSGAIVIPEDKASWQGQERSLSEVKP